MLEINRNIIVTLAYFDMFNYPLTRTEIFLFLPAKHNHAEVDIALSYLVANHSIYRFDDFYTLKNDSTVITRRLEGNNRATELITVAKKVSKLLIRFPYVRGVAVSGSLSKNYADEGSDIDFFIITAKNRLWIARTLMHAFKKLTFLFNKQHYFCMNYYVDEAQLKISEQNIYTAIEVVTLIPLQGDSAFNSFFAANSWTKSYLPNNYLRVLSASTPTDSWLKRTVEKLLSNRIGCLADRWLMRFTDHKWKRKTEASRLNDHGNLLSMVAEPHCSKPNPTFFQPMLLNNYTGKVARLVERYEESMAY